MDVNDAAHVRHAAVAYFRVVLVKDDEEIVVWCEVFLDEVVEGFGDVGLYTFASTRGRSCGYIFLAVVKGFVKASVEFISVVCFIGPEMPQWGEGNPVCVRTYIYMQICPFSYFYNFLSA